MERRHCAIGYVGWALWAEFVPGLGQRVINFRAEFESKMRSLQINNHLFQLSTKINLHLCE